MAPNPVQKNFLILVLLVGVIALATLFFSQKEFKNSVIADFSYNGISLYQIKDKPVILHFWATWCAPCIEELPRLLQKSKETPEAQFILISVDRNKKDMDVFLKKQNIPKNVTIVYDTGMLITINNFNISQFPETLILNPDKTLQDHFIGPVNWEKIEITR